jgi:hypothetical protein
MRRLFVFLAAIMFLTSCGGRSNVTADVVPMEYVCAYEKWKTVAVEGYLAPDTMVCERATRKKRSGVVWCAFKVYADQNLTGASISVEIPFAGWINGRNNRMDGPPSRTEDLRIYDNDGQLIPSGSKIRVFGELPKSSNCEFGLVDRIDRVS